MTHLGGRSTGKTGQWAEQLAFEFLVERKLQPLVRNFRWRGGEIDLVMLDRDCLTFVEVRYRSSTKFTSASHTVDRQKQHKVIQTAAMFVARNHAFSTATMRFDVVAIEGPDGQRIHWLKDAFRPNHSTL